jgi:hypothetical protein
MKKSPSVQHRQSFSRPALSPFLYDLGAATRALPLAAVLPEQFHSSSSNVDTSRGEIALMRAVLENAIDCFQKQGRRSNRRTQRLAQEAEEWFFKDDQQWPFSFLNICNVLGIDTGYLRRGLKQWKEEHTQIEPHKQRETQSPRTFPIAA